MVVANSGRSSQLLLPVLITRLLSGMDAFHWPMIIVFMSYWSVDSWPCVVEDVPQVEFMYRAFTRMPGENYRRQLRSLLLCFV